jgi:hypothetical protein
VADNGRVAREEGGQSFAVGIRRVTAPDRVWPTKRSQSRDVPMMCPSVTTRDATIGVANVAVGSTGTFVLGRWGVSRAVVAIGAHGTGAAAGALRRDPDSWALEPLVSSTGGAVGDVATRSGTDSAS